MIYWFAVDNHTQKIVNLVDWDGVTDVAASYPDATLYPVQEGVEVGWFRKEDGTYEEFPIGMKKLRLKEEVMKLLQVKFNEGYTPSTGPIAGHTLQCRDSEDRTNWLTSQTSYMAAIQMGYGDVPGATFRTMGNATITLTFNEGLQVLTNGMAVWGKNLMAHSWALKDEITAASTEEELDAIDIHSNWPTG